MEKIRVRFLEKKEQVPLPVGVKMLPESWQKIYIEKRKPFRLEGDTAILHTTAENGRTSLWRNNAVKLLEALKKKGVSVIIPPAEGDLPREILPFADGRRLTNLFAFQGAREVLKRQGKQPEECRYLLAGGNEAAWRAALVSMGNEANHLSIFTADVGEAKKLEQELFAEWGLLAEVFASPKNPVFQEADVVFGCGMEQRKYEYMLKEGAVWIDLAGNRPVLRKLTEKRPDVTAVDGFFFRKGKKQLEGRSAEAEAFLSCPAFRENWESFPEGDAGKEILCALQEMGYGLSGFSLMEKRVKIRRKP